jgi:flagella basal body P-ring formation protein FlgA
MPANSFQFKLFRRLPGIGGLASNFAANMTWSGWWLPAILTFVGLWSPVGNAQEIHLFPEADVTDGIVRLGDIAEISGGSYEEREALAALELRPYAASKPVLKAQEIREEIHQAGWNLLYWRVTGASDVHFRGRTAGSLGRRQLEVHRLPTTNAPIRMTQKLPTTHPNTQRTGVVRAQWQELDLGAFEPVPQILAPVTAAPATVRVLVFKQSMHRGQIITADDLEWIDWDRRVPPGYLQDVSQAIGKVVRNPAAARQPVLLPALEEIKYVQRGKEVKLVSRVGMIEVSTVGRALSDGVMDGTVTVESLDRQRRFIGRVVGFAEVQVDRQNESADPTIVAQNQPAVSQRRGGTRSSFSSSTSPNPWR